MCSLRAQTISSNLELYNVRDCENNCCFLQKRYLKYNYTVQHSILLYFRTLPNQEHFLLNNTTTFLDACTHHNHLIRSILELINRPLSLVRLVIYTSEYHMNGSCQHAGCNQLSQLRCSGCRLVFYCSQEHQKIDWKRHKVVCKLNRKTEIIETIDLTTCATNSQQPLEQKAADIQKRECRCMFCGESLMLESEEEAMNHMMECCALQEQLASKDQFTIPSMFKERIPHVVTSPDGDT